MTLTASSISWAIDSVSIHSDSDLFPRIQELEAIKEKRDDFISLVSGKPLTQFLPGPHRRFIVPKDELSYRQATQLDPQDSILLTATIQQFGAAIEARRLGPDKVSSYRFSPTPDHGLYDFEGKWNEFWRQARLLSLTHSHILYADIADFYNQIYHHEVENQLLAANLPNQVIKWIMALLSSTTVGVSRGLPIGPHPIHLIAEATLIAIDDSIRAAGIDFIRYADDYLVFCHSREQARASLSTIATILDRSQRLLLQRHKTRVYSRADFEAFCEKMMEDRPIDQNEADLLDIIKKYSGDNPYAAIRFSQISPSDWAAISESAVRRIIEQYLGTDPVDYVRLRWFYRRLAQIGHPGALAVSLDRFSEMAPCLASVCHYLGSIQAIDPADWARLGKRLLGLLASDVVRNSEYFVLLVLSLFSRNAYVDHFADLGALFDSASASTRREILLAAKANAEHSWARQYKEGFAAMDPWQKWAFVYCISGLPRDEKRYFLKRTGFDRPFEATLAKWSGSI